MSLDGITQMRTAFPRRADVQLRAEQRLSTDPKGLTQDRNLTKAGG